MLSENFILYSNCSLPFFTGPNVVYTPRREESLFKFLKLNCINIYIYVSFEATKIIFTLFWRDSIVVCSPFI